MTPRINTSGFLLLNVVRRHTGHPTGEDQNTPTSGCVLLSRTEISHHTRYPRLRRSAQVRWRSRSHLSAVELSPSHERSTPFIFGKRVVAQIINYYYSFVRLDTGTIGLVPRTFYIGVDHMLGSGLGDMRTRTRTAPAPSESERSCCSLATGPAE